MLRVFALAPFVVASVVGCTSPAQHDGLGDGPEGGSEDAEPVSTTEQGPWSCRYDDPLVGPSCRAYAGPWERRDVLAACAELDGSLMAEPCERADALGECTFEAAPGLTVGIVFYRGDAPDCAALQQQCEVYGGGVWTPWACQTPGTPAPDVFVPPVRVCRDPLPGEPAGASEGGRVCTWQMFSGCTEPGRHFADYASCEVIATQREYYPMEPHHSAEAAASDPRLRDASYRAELDWVRSQVEASACVCCHSELAPAGPSGWSVDMRGNWSLSLSDRGLALGAGFIDSSALGAYAAAQNNGFERSAAIPSTDPARLQAFFAAELAHRGRQATDFELHEPFGGALYQQLVYRLGECEAGVGVDGRGRLHWRGGDARYVYVLSEGSANPTVPPNLDIPVGTLWRVDVPVSGTPVRSGSLVYGELVEGLVQRMPATGRPPALSVGQRYHLYVLADIGEPLTRCRFTHAG